METLNCFDLHDLVLNDDDNIQDAYCKLYNFCMKSLKCSTKLKANFKKVKLERDELIAKLDEANNSNEKFKNQISSQLNKIKSLKEQLVESKTKVEKLTSAKLVVEPNSKEKDFYIPPFKRNNEELKDNIARIDKGKNSGVNVEVSKPMSKTTPRLNKNFEFVLICHHYHIIGHIRPNCPKLRSLSTSKIRSPSRKPSSSKTAHPLSKGSVPILGALLKVLSFLTQFQGNSNSFMSFSSHTRTRAFSSSRPRTCIVWVIKDLKI